MNDETPNWDALPARPAEFFGLDENADPQKLKSAYTRLIRRFKPERYPQEFQRIRAAYEQLDAQLRYGRAPREDGNAPPSPARTFEPAPNAAHVQTNGQSPLELVQLFGPRAAFERLKSVPQRTTQQWCAMVLIADALSTRTDTARVLAIEGLAQSRGALELMAWVELLLRGIERNPDAPKVLLSLAKRSAGPGRDAGYPPFLFWYLTQSAWNALAAQDDAQRSVKLIERCAAELGPGGRIGELVLKLRLRRTLALSADESTLQGLDRELSENLRHLPTWAEPEYDLALWLARYRDVRGDFRNGDELRETLDTALSAIVAGDEVRADREFFAAMVKIHERSAELTDSLPHEGPTLDTDLFAIGILCWYSDEWRARRALTTAVPVGAARECSSHLKRLERRGNRSVAGILRSATVLLVMGLLLVLLIAAGVASQPQLGSAWPGVSIGLGIGLWCMIKAGLFDRFLTPVAMWFARPILRRIWRPETARFIADTRIPIDEVIRVARGSENTSAAFPAEAFEDDPALRLMTLAASNVD